MNRNGARPDRLARFSVTDFRNRFTRHSVVWVAICSLAAAPVSRSAAAGMFIGGMASIIVQRARILTASLAADSVNSIKWNLSTWGILRWAVYAAVFYIGYRVGGGTAAGIVGTAAGLLIPLAVMVCAGTKDVDREAAE